MSTLTHYAKSLDSHFQTLRREQELLALLVDLKARLDATEKALAWAVNHSEMLANRETTNEHFQTIKDALARWAEV